MAGQPRLWGAIAAVAFPFRIISPAGMPYLGLLSDASVPADRIRPIFEIVPSRAGQVARLASLTTWLKRGTIGTNSDSSLSFSECFGPMSFHSYRAAGGALFVLLALALAGC